MADETSQQLTTLLSQGQALLSQGQFARAESNFAQALALDPGNPQAREGLRRAQSGLENDGASEDESIDWQAHYDAGADASLDLPPPLARDLVHDTLSAPVVEEYDQPDPEPVAPEEANPTMDPFLRPQSEFSAPAASTADRPAVTRIEIEERSSEPPTEPEREDHDTEPPSGEPVVPDQQRFDTAPSSALLRPEAATHHRPGDILPSVEPELELSYDTLEESADIDPGEMELEALLLLAQRRHKAGDFAGASGLLERLLAEVPDHPDGLRLNAENNARLIKSFEARLGDLTRSPNLRLRQEEFVWQSLNHHEGFVLSQVDGMTSYADLIEISTLPRLDVVRILARLVDLGIIG